MTMYECRKYVKSRGIEITDGEISSIAALMLDDEGTKYFLNARSGHGACDSCGAVGKTHGHAVGREQLYRLCDECFSKAQICGSPDS